jgi:glutamyl/glutaminyl-tRNA synthetase
MFKALGWEAPKYAHLPVIMKLDHGNKRKLSKRKDPEAAVSAISWKVVIRQRLCLIYLMSIANQL